MGDLQEDAERERETKKGRKTDTKKQTSLPLINGKTEKGETKA